MSNNDVGDWICADCGRSLGYPKIRISTYHEDWCEYCGCLKQVTETRDWGYPELPSEKSR